MDLLLKGKTAIVTGSSRGIGKSIAELLHQEGCNVMLNGRHTAILKKISKTLPNSSYYACDVTNPQNCRKLIEHTIKTWGQIDLLICNVGSGKSVMPGKETNYEWKHMFDLNFFSSTNMIEASKKHLKKTSGSIVCISSITGIETLGAPITYSIAKTALNQYVKAISKHLAQINVRINAVVPGNIFFKGSVWEKKLLNDKSAIQKMLNQNVALKRFGHPEEIANCVIFLCSPLSSFVTGSLLIADGGQIRS